MGYKILLSFFLDPEKRDRNKRTPSLQVRDANTKIIRVFGIYLTSCFLFFYLDPKKRDRNNRTPAKQTRYASTKSYSRHYYFLKGANEIAWLSSRKTRTAIHVIFIFLLVFMFRNTSESSVLPVLRDIQPQEIARG